MTDIGIGRVLGPRHWSGWKIAALVTVGIVFTPGLAACSPGHNTKPVASTDGCNGDEYDGPALSNSQQQAAENVDETTGSVSGLYTGNDTSTDTWYGSSPCDWSIGGDVPPDASNPDIDGSLKQAGITQTSADLKVSLKQAGDQLGQIAANQPLVPSDLRPVPCRGEARAQLASYEVPRQLEPTTTTTIARLATTTSTASPSPTARTTAPTSAVSTTTNTRESTTTSTTQKSSPCYTPPAQLPKLDPKKPFSGRDIIFVHGLRNDPIFAQAKFQTDPAHTNWPQNAVEFYNQTGYWKAPANQYWSDDITRYLRGGNAGGQASNRYLTIAWPTTQRLVYGANAMLDEIADAMNTGTGVINEVNPADRGGFCAAQCVIVSHSTGGPLTDVAMALAQATKSNALFRHALGDVGFIPDHMRAHVALHGAFSGSADATPMVAVGLAGGGALCTVATTVANVVFHGGIPGCASLSTFPSSVLMDLVPQVMQVVWGPWIDATPVPTLTTAGGHPTSIDAGPVGKTLVQNLVRHVLHEGFDDGVLTDNSQCANPNPTASWPSGYVARPGIPLLVRVFDFGHPQRGVGYFIDQAIDPKLAGNSLPVFAAGACTPFVAPDGMVQPINYSGTLALWATRPDNPLDRYKNHYSFLLTASDHSIGPTGPFELPGLCYEETSLLSNTHHCNNDNSDNYEETRAITDPAIYSTGLVNSAMKTMVVESVKGKRIKIGKKKFWIWKRVYHTLAGSKQMIELDYVFKYVLK